MKNRKSIKLINELYSCLEFLNGKKMGAPYRDQVYALAIAGERRHRRGVFGGGPYHITVDAAAKYFTVRWIADIGVGRTLTVAALLDLRPDAQLGAMVAAKYREEIWDALKGAVKGEDIQAFAGIDYAKLAKGEGE